jgi:hypothetical protein
MIWLLGANPCITKALSKPSGMLGYLAAMLALLAGAIVTGMVPLPTGPWPGISLGLVGAVAGWLEVRRRPDGRGRRLAAWVGAVGGVLAVGLGVALYLGLVVAARQLG